MKRALWLAILLNAVGACTRPLPAVEVTPVTVQVLETDDQCVVDGQSMRCEQIGVSLRDSMHIPTDRRISLSMQGTPFSTAQARHVQDILRAAGYAHLITVGFLSEPGKP